MDNHEVMLPLPIIQRIDSICVQFEDDWVAGKKPRVEQFSDQLEPQWRSALVEQLVRVEVECRVRQGSNPTWEEYELRFPALESDIRSILSDIRRKYPDLGPPMSRDATSPVSDYNLLFGVVALQLDLINRDQLVNAMNRWVLDKTRRLGEILVEQGALDEEARTRLEGVVDVQIKHHQNDVRRSLSVIQTSSDLNSKLRWIDDPDLALSLFHLAPTLREPGMPSGQPTGGPTTQAHQRFDRLRWHAGGGLGDVYVARDRELNRDVAVKQIKEQHADDEEGRRRFLLEAEITGSLEHPGVVPVYGLGQYDDGRPYYAMRLIGGESLRDAIRQFHSGENGSQDYGSRVIELRRLLDRFVDVCHAMDYAHSRGVLHRDLKPDNIMLGRYGETLVVDWGLAKVVGRQEDRDDKEELTLRPSSASATMETLAGSALGTIQYMSPEQAAGRLDQLGARSDIYCLGATLFAILTGRPPIERQGKQDDVETMCERVRRGDFPRPRQLNQQAPAALEAVCLKAMALEPYHRYDSVRQMTRDIQSWLADEPVSAYREPATVRIRRWLARRRALVTSTAAALAVALVCLLIGVVLLSIANERERQSNREAVANFRLARDAVDRFLTNVSEDPRLKAAGLESLRHDLLTTAREFYDEFVKQRADDPELQAERGRAFGRLALITNELGSPQKAIQLQEKAMAIFGGLPHTLADKSDSRYELGRLHQQLGDLYAVTERKAEAEQAFRQALELFRQLSDDHPTAGNYAGSLAVAHDSLGSFYEDYDRLDDARQQHEASLRILSKLVAQDPEDHNFRHLLSRSHYNVGQLRQRDGALQASQAAVRAALEIRQGLRDEGTKLLENDYWLAACHHKLAWLHVRGGQLESAEREFQVARQMFQQLSDHHPDVPKYQYHLASVLNEIGILHKDRQQFDDAERIYQAALQTSQTLVKQHADVTVHHEELAKANFNLGWVYYNTERYGESRQR